ncbi:styrene monooxygenase/indole monooxygenase family protein [Streptomyces telluris]|uniref:FAD-binding oxidoreductase n=1 Tax=Streptomyces telluris TaxID=2720021 RepID=A0A9X2RM97_9ACTN|nr:styrene monooxygenase/indole monooxygenase family protein [Streptomyces telluris]MCQ8768900.1 FAD-binding oxidoreductase [Streptomyces telluris]NJP76557.1 FAD-binding oxidoreductase [Streptomyces telluris]
MRRILIAGAGQSGLQLALGLQFHGYDVTLMSNRTSEEIRSGRVTSTQCMFATALRHEHELGLGFWAASAPRIEGVGVSVAEPVPGGHRRAVDWLGRLDGCAQSVDQRLKMSGWLDTFAERGGRLVVHAAAVSDLDALAGHYDLVLVATGKGELAELFDRDPARSPHTVPQRALAVAYVHGLGPRPEHAGTEAVRCNLVPGAGELFVLPTLTVSGRADVLFWEAVPDGPLDVFQDQPGPDEHLARTLELMELYAPWEYARATRVELTDAHATLAGRYTPAVRDPVGRLPSGGVVLGVGDAVVADDPVTGQGANSAAKCAAAYLAAIVQHGERPFDAAWMRTAFDRHWATARHATAWTHAMLAPRQPPHVRELLAAAAGLQPVADRIANGFDDPADFADYFYEPERAAAYVAEAEKAASSGGTEVEAPVAGAAG